MTHLTDDELRVFARAGHSANTHLDGCADCRVRWQSWQRLTEATRHAADQLAPRILAVPAFDELIGRHLPVTASSAPAVPAANRRRPRWWHVTGLLAWWQLRLMPRTLLPLSVAGLTLAVMIALVTPDPTLGSRYFAAGVVLVTLLSSLAACSRRAGSRTELLCALPTSPVTVFTARLVLVLSVSLLLALVGSVVVHVAGVELPMFDLVSGWLGQSLLASAIAVAGAVRYSTGAGAAASVAAWCLGSLASMSRGGLAARVGTVVSQIWGTTPWTVAVAVAVFVVAVRQVRQLPERPRRVA